MGLGLTLLYRGPLSSCNYRCDYCPFAKQRDSAAELRYDQQCLERFIQWLESRNEQLHSVFFTPWGEALTRRWYHDAMLRLDEMPHVQRIACQTNLSFDLSWLNRCTYGKIALWATYHPDQVSLDSFLDQCFRLDDLGVRYSVGIVGLQEHLELAEAMRQRLADNTYLWINAYKREKNYYDRDTFERFKAIDPLFPINSLRHPSLGKACRTGQTVVSIDGEGNVKRCHFVDQKIGNIYQQDLDTLLKPRLCPNQTCGCHIGYVHMPDLGLEPVFGDGILERIPLAGSFRSEGR